MTKLRFEKTCNTCPEQYDVFKGERQVGYVRLRGGRLTVDYPDVDGECIYRHIFDDKWKGCFDDYEERDKFLNEISEVILNKVKEKNE